jgi:hypothetical protein
MVVLAAVVVVLTITIPKELVVQQQVAKVMLVVMEQ